MTRPPDRTAKVRKRRWRYRKKLGQRVVGPLALNSDTVDVLAFKFKVVRIAVDNDGDLSLAIEEVLEQIANPDDDP